MSKTLKNLLIILGVIATAVLGVIAWKKFKEMKNENNGSSDIFEEDDFDLDEAI